MALSNAKVETYQKLAYKKDDVIYLPHYNIANRYVSPGYGLKNLDLYTEGELKSMGCKPQVLMLWSRSW